MKRKKNTGVNKPETMVRPTINEPIRIRSLVLCPLCGAAANVTKTMPLTHPSVIAIRVRYYKCGASVCGYNFKN
jgi:hypothetical protein